MEQSTLQPTTTTQPPGTPGAAQPAPSGSAGALLRRYPEIAAAAGLLIVSTIIVIWARTRPGFDPYGWLVWGHQTVAGNLDTNAAPSWKPLPYLFTLPFGLFGHYQLWLWMITAVAFGLAGSLFAARIAWVLVGETPGRGYARIAAAAFAGVALLGISDYSHYILSAQSDPMIVTLTLAAIDCHLQKRPRWAYACAVLASLGRPEIWPFMGAYAIWAWRAIPAMRRFIAGGLVVLLALWFGIPALTSRSAFVAGSNAMGSGRALHNDKVFGTINRFLGLHAWPLELLALGAVVWAALRRDRLTLALAAIVVVWVVLEIAFALHGWPGLPRYMFGAGGVMVVLAAVAVGRLLAEPPKLSQAAGLAGIALVVIACGALVPTALSRARTEHRDLKAQRARTTEINRLASTISKYGGAARLRACGEPLTRLEYQTVLAWQLHDNVVVVGFKYAQAIHHGNPIVLFTPTHRGWKLQALHQRLASCRSLPR